MSKRLQVVVPDAEYQRLRRIARSHRTTLAEWVRRILRSACTEEPGGDVSRKLEAIRAAARHSFPTADIEQMLAEVDRGRFQNSE